MYGEINKYTFVHYFYNIPQDNWLMLSIIGKGEEQWVKLSRVYNVPYSTINPVPNTNSLLIQIFVSEKDVVSVPENSQIY